MTQKSASLKFIILLGFVSLCADATYEGARSITGAFLGTLGASGTIVGLVAGLGELIGYGLRLVTGYLSDQTRKYWGITTLGYFINTAAVPLLALAGRWEVAAGLMIAERTGKAIRTPARDVLLSHAAMQVGRGFGFGLRSDGSNWCSAGAADSYRDAISSERISRGFCHSGDSSSFGISYLACRAKDLSKSK